MLKGIKIERQISMTVDYDENLDNGYESVESNSSVPDRFPDFTANGLMRVGEESPEHEIIKKSFVSGMGFAGRDTSVLAVHKNLGPGLTRKARSEAFRIFSEAVAQKNGGNANVKYAWYGGSKDEICEIVVHGFSHCRKPAADDQTCGVGIHLVPANFSFDGALSAAADGSGLRHILLCRVILGKSELVQPGSKQFHPGSKEFDSGLDNLLNPRKYIVWTAFMNSHIFPAYVVSFRAPCLKAIQTKQEIALKPTSPWMSFPTLMSILARFLHPSKMAILVKCHNEFRAKKIRRPQLIQKVRHIAGDKLLIAVIKSYRTKALLAKSVV